MARLALAGLVLFACLVLLLSQAEAADRASPLSSAPSPHVVAIVAEWGSDLTRGPLRDSPLGAARDGSVPVARYAEAGTLPLRPTGRELEQLRQLYETLRPLLLLGDGVDVGLTKRGLEAGVRLRL